MFPALAALIPTLTQWVSTLAAGLVAGLSTLVTKAGAALRVVFSNMPRLGEMADAIAEARPVLELLKSDDPRELGRKALTGQDKEITPENYSDVESYLEDVRAIKLESQEVEELDEKDTDVATVGLAIAALAEEIGGEEVEAYLALVLRPSDFLDNERLSHYLQQALSGNLQMSAVRAYFEGQLWGLEESDAEEQIVAAEQMRDADVNKEGLLTEIRNERS